MTMMRTKHWIGRRKRPMAAGFSLLELMVVVMILAITALIVVPRLNSDVQTASGHRMSAKELTSRTTLDNVRAAFTQANGMIAHLAHEPAALPTSVDQLVRKEPHPNLIQFANYLKEHNPQLNVGWNGPYLEPNSHNELGLATVADAWGNEIQLQIDFDRDGIVDELEGRYMRLVSAGQDGEIDTPYDTANIVPGSDPYRELTADECGDDLVLFVRVSDDRQ